MSQYYNPRRTRNLYNPKASDPFRVSRSKIDLYVECPRCFYADRRLGVGRPPGLMFNLNSAVDKLLKKEFDLTLIAYQGNDAWVEGKIKEIYACLQQNQVPSAGKDCDYCAYIGAIDSITK